MREKKELNWVNEAVKNWLLIERYILMENLSNHFVLRTKLLASKNDVLC